MDKGSQALWDLGTRYRNIGDKELQKKVQVEINKALRVTEAQIRAAALTELPRRGGLAKWVAEAPITVRTAKNSAKVGKNSAHSFGAWIIQGLVGHNFAAIDRGRLRHPTFGRRTGNTDWQTQEITKGYFTLTITRNLPRIMKKLETAAYSVLK
jgi:hypothetical protein